MRGSVYSVMVLRGVWWCCVCVCVCLCVNIVMLFYAAWEVCVVAVCPPFECP